MMDEVSAVKDILRDALSRIDQMPSQASSNNTTLSNNTTSTTTSSNNTLFLSRAQNNFRTAFPHLYGRRTASQITDGGNNVPKPKRKPKQYLPFFVKDSWTKDFLVLSSTSDDKTPRADALQSLKAAGLGKVKVVFKNKNGDFNHLKSTLEDHFPKLKSQNGAFELLRADRGGNARPLIGIQIPNTGYTIKYLKDSVPGSAVIYLRPMQSDLDMSVVPDNEQGVKAHTQCVNCHESVPLVGIREHFNQCRGGSSSMTSPEQENNPPPQSVNTIVLDDIEEHEGDGHIAVHPSTEDRAAWILRLQEMFPKVPRMTLELTAKTSTSLQEAVEEVCDKEIQETPPQVLTISEILSKVQSGVRLSDYTLAVNRDSFWMGALRFYKMAVNEKEKLWQGLAIIFEGEEGLDAGALKTEFFELLLKEMQQRLFEGPEEAKLPVRDSSKSFLLKLAGVAVSHSIIQKGPVFGALSPAVYHYLAGGDPDMVASLIEKDDVPENAGTATLHELMNLLMSDQSVGEVLADHPSADAFWAIINASHWPSEKQITMDNRSHLLQHLLENEIIYSRKMEIDQFAEGLKVMGLLQIIRENPIVSYELLCHDPKLKLTAEKFLSQVNLEEPSDFSEKQSYNWFLKFVNSADDDVLTSLLQFTTGHKTIPPCGLPHRICIKYLADDDAASLPKSSACLAILNLPTVHSSEKKFNESLVVALKCECEGFGSA